MNSVIVRYAIFILIIVFLFGIGVGYILLQKVNTHSPSVTTSNGDSGLYLASATSANPATPATSAQPSDGKGIPAVPAIPAQKATPASPLKKDKPNRTDEYLSVDRPEGGAGWVRTTPLNILWEWNIKNQDNKELQFDVNLLKGGNFYAKITSITEPVNSDAWFDQVQWYIPKETPAGSDYRIQVKQIGKGKTLTSTNAKNFSILGDTITIKGRLIDLYTKSPLDKITISPYGAGNPLVTTNANGAFSYTIPTVYTEGSPQNYSLPEVATGSYSAFFGQETESKFHQCYPWYSVFWVELYDPNNPFWTATVLGGNWWSYGIRTSQGWPSDEKYFPVLSNTIDVGDVSIRPVAHFIAFSDVIGNMTLDYEGVNGGNDRWGYGSQSNTYQNSVYSGFPVKYNTRVIFNAGYSNASYSTWHQVGLDQACKDQLLTYLNGTFTWESYIISIASSGNWSGKKDSPFEVSLSANGGTAPYQWSVKGDKLPSGITLDESSGIISGIPTEAGLYKTAILVTDSSGTHNGMGFWINISN